MRVLVAVSNSLPKTGYVQGLNSIGSALLAQDLTEQQSYWMLLYLLKKCKVNELVAEGFPKVQILNYQLEIFMRNYLPDIIDHLVRSLYKLCSLLVVRVNEESISVTLQLNGLLHFSHMNLS